MYPLQNLIASLWRWNIQLGEYLPRATLAQLLYCQAAFDALYHVPNYKSQLFYFCRHVIDKKNVLRYYNLKAVECKRKRLSCLAFPVMSIFKVTQGAKKTNFQACPLIILWCTSMGKSNYHSLNKTFLAHWCSKHLFIGPLLWY